MEDEDEEEDEYHPKKMQYLSTGLSYAQSVSRKYSSLSLPPLPLFLLPPPDDSFVSYVLRLKLWRQRLLD
jgi:hypothetical protein